jgi:hypothetical protein
MKQPYGYGKGINDSKLPGGKFLGLNPYTGGNRCLLRHEEPIKGLSLHANFAWSTIIEVWSEEFVQLDDGQKQSPNFPRNTSAFWL